MTRSGTRPSLEVERELIGEGHVVVGIDEVGRGAVAGPLMVGAVVIMTADDPPDNVDDSKRLTARARERLVEPIRAWAADVSIGTVDADEIDAWGLRRALTLCALRTLSSLKVRPSIALLDGSQDFLRSPAELSAPTDELDRLSIFALPTRVIVGGDRSSATIAAASVVAKVARDAFMEQLSIGQPDYGWAANKGYLSDSHAEALRAHGQTKWHRRSWSIPG